MKPILFNSKKQPCYLFIIIHTDLNITPYLIPVDEYNALKLDIYQNANINELPNCLQSGMNSKYEILFIPSAKYA